MAATAAWCCGQAGSDPYDYSSVASYAGDGSLASAAEGWIEEWDEVNSRSYW